MKIVYYYSTKKKKNSKQIYPHLFFHHQALAEWSKGNSLQKRCNVWLIIIIFLSYDFKKIKP